MRRAHDAGSDDHTTRGLFHLGRLGWRFHRFTEAERRLRATERLGVELARAWQRAHTSCCCDRRARHLE